MGSPTLTYVICSAPWSGADLLAGCLDQASATGTTLLWQDLPAASGADRHADLAARHPTLRTIWLRRRDTVMRAVNSYRAATPEPPFDEAGIERHRQLAVQTDRAWYNYIMGRKLPALVVVLEDFLQDYERTLRGVLHFLRLDPAAAPPPCPVLAEPDPVTQDWAQRFRTRHALPPEPSYTPVRPIKRKRPVKSGAPLPLIAYDLGAGVRLPLEPSPVGRPWMDATTNRFAYRCLPLVIANQAGWVVRNTHRLTVEWDGTQGTDGLRIGYGEPVAAPYAVSHFGGGVLTFTIGYLFRTPPGYNLQIRGPVNWPKDGISPLDGIVETDWTHASFTMNWKLTRPGLIVTFEPDEPIATIVPIARAQLEHWAPEIQPIAADADWQRGYTAWSGLRTSFNAALTQRRPQAVAAGWQRHYLLGMNVAGEHAPDHHTGLQLQPFADRRPAHA